MRSSASDSSHRPSPGPASTAPPSPTRCSRLAASLYVAIEQIQNRRLGRCHREVPPASPLSRPPRAAARIAPTARRRPHRAHRVPTSASPPPSLSLRCGGPRALTGKNRTVCIPFSPNARKRPPSWQHPPEMHALRDQNGSVLAPCIHSRVQSGDSGYMARESCRQGPFFASRSPKSRMARRCCQRRPAFPRQRHAAWPNGLCGMRHAACGTRHSRTGFAPCGAGLACLPHARPLPSRLCPPRPAPPRHLARVHRRRLTRVALRRPHCVHRAQPSATPPIAVGVSRLSVSSCCPRAANADASRPPMRARRHRPSPNPSQPSPSPEPTGPQPRASRVPARPWSHLRPPAPRHPPRLALPRGSRCGSRNSREMVR